MKQVNGSRCSCGGLAGCLLVSQASGGARACTIVSIPFPRGTLNENATICDDAIVLHVTTAVTRQEKGSLQKSPGGDALIEQSRQSAQQEGTNGRREKNGTHGDRTSAKLTRTEETPERTP